jgi:hypothetical protein
MGWKVKSRASNGGAACGPNFLQRLPEHGRPPRGNRTGTSVQEVLLDPVDVRVLALPEQ